MFLGAGGRQLTMEMTRVIKQFNDAAGCRSARNLHRQLRHHQDQSRIGAEGRQPPALVIMSANFTTDLALKDEILPMDELFKYGDQKAGNFLQTEFWPAMHKNAGDGHPPMRSCSTRRRSSTTTRRCSIGPGSNSRRRPGRVAGRCQKADRREHRPVGIMLPSTNDDFGGWIFSALVRANGGKYFNEDYPGEVYYNSPTTIGALRFWRI